MKNFEQITTRGAIEYITSYIDTMRDMILQGDPRSTLFEERIAFLSKAVKDLRTIK